MKKIILIIMAVVVVGIDAYFIFQKPSPPIPSEPKPPIEKAGKCGDNVCDEFEKANPNACPQDCAGKETPDEKKYKCPQYTPPAPSFYENCENKDGSVEAGEKDENGCQMTPQCVLPNVSSLKTSSSKQSSIPTTNSSSSSQKMTSSSSSSKSSSVKSKTMTSEDSPFGFHPALPLEDAKEMGVKWARGSDTPYLFWELIDPNKKGAVSEFQWRRQVVRPDGVPSFIDYDNLLLVKEAGLHLLQNIDVGGGKTHFKSGSWLPTDETAYKTFVKEAVKRYSFIKYWQVGNEPLLKEKTSGFAKLQQITYEVIKEANPNAKVLIAGLAGNMDTDSINDSSYESILKELNGKYIDIFDIHFYGDAKGGTAKHKLPNGTEIRILGYRDFKTVYEYYRELLDKNGFSNVPIWITEMGTPSGTSYFGSYTMIQTEAEQARDMLKRYVYPLSLGVKKVFWAFNIIEGFGEWDDDFFDHTGFVYSDKDGIHKIGDKKLAYHAFKKMTEILEGSDWDNIQTIQEKDGVYAYKFVKNGKPIWVAWNDNSGEKQITISGINSSSVKITEAVPNYDSGKEVTNYNTAFKTEMKQTNDGKLTMTLGKNPVFIEGN